MYRTFKSGNTVSKKDTHVEESEPSSSNPELEKQVSECWTTILSTCSQNTENSELPNPPITIGGWRTVRIFVSSTFMDFFSEREILVKKVFPDLREWCHERKLKLVECDLRWGVPKDATSTQALVTCLEEIDRCYEANGHPFFLALLGERYGWIPGQTEVPEEVKKKYTWVDGTSMTFMEILHGALRIDNPNAAFFLRNPDFISELPDGHVDRFKSDSELGKEHLKALKSHLTKQFPQQVFTYTAKSGGVSTSTGRELMNRNEVNLTGLNAFADQVKEFFKTAIEKAYPPQDDIAELTPEQKETELQLMFAQDKAESLSGRDDELKALLDYSNGKSVSSLSSIEGKASTIRKAEEWDAQDGDEQLCIVTGEGGWGKTALLAGLVCQAMKQGQTEVFYHFVGSTASSRSHINLVQRLLLAVCPNAEDPEVKDPEGDLDSKKKLLRKMLAGWRERSKEMLIVIDGVNELDNSGSVYHLSWLPPSLPRGLRCVVSSNVSHLPTTARLYEHPAYHLALTAMESTALQNIGVKYLARFGKKLESSQLEALVGRTKVDNPLWMMLMCEDLRVFGDFRMMDQKLNNLPDTMDGFLATVISRLLSEDEEKYVKRVLFLTACSTSGLPTDYILRLLGDMDSKEECPPLYWAQVRCILKPYSRIIRASSDGQEYFTFVHEAMWKAVRQCMSDLGVDVKLWHKQLADVYQYWCDSSVLRVNNLPYQLEHASMSRRLIEFIRRDQDAARMPAFQRSQYLNQLRCRNPSDAVVPNTREVYICQVCQNRQGGFNPGVLFPNKDVCYMCSNITFSGNRHTARICFVHAMKGRMGPNISPCCLCNQPIFLTDGRAKKPFGPKPACLCQFCGFGIYAKMCCNFKDFIE